MLLSLCKITKDLDLSHKHHKKKEAIDSITFVEELLLLEETNMVRLHMLTKGKADFTLVDHIDPSEQKELDYLHIAFENYQYTQGIVDLELDYTSIFVIKYYKFYFISF